MQLPTVQTRFLDLPGSFSLRNGAVLDKVRVAFVGVGERGSMHVGQMAVIEGAEKDINTLQLDWQVKF